MYWETLGDRGMTALKHAVKQRNTSIVRLLLEHGADVNAQTSNDEE
jgi:ankyrin repeat protein